ncbi:MAG: SUMF1/EgtB/PvdO family nonheme iron enzyme [Chloroflexota bacterium]|nr:SUMF1/EgtB/PvdO family nonheme iron enzyme [Chloroflexota bacterium]
MSKHLRAPSRPSTVNERECRAPGSPVIDCTTSPRIGRVVRCLALAGLLLVPWSAAAELEPALQADLYLVQTEAYIKEKNYAAAEETMSKMTALRKEHDIPATDEFHFIYAQVLDLAGAHTEAVASLTRYLELTGNTGQHYWDALELLHRAMESAEQLTHADRVFRDCAECPELVVVPAGTFMMGAPRSEEGRSDNELPRHRVTIREPFAVGVYEVTFAEWDACVDAGGCGRIPDDEGWGRGRRPVINVSWDDAQGYVRWLSDRTGKEYRLLSESEWEYVARAGTETPFHFGSTLSTSQANYIEDFTYGNGSTGEYRGQTVEVGTFAANKYGLHDVHGNVFEWVEDCWNDSYTGAPSDGSAWERGDCSGRVSRGGAWNFKREQLRSAYRFIRNDTGHRINHLGFRVARTEFLDLYLWRTGWRHIVPATTPPRN